ncbi:MAG TPA: hypothetical protein VF008_28665, partial [Niastella sp.]
MKKILSFLFLLLSCYVGETQILKKLGDKVKEEAEYRIRRKAGQKMDEGIDKVFDLPKKIKINKRGNEPEIDQADKETKKNKKESKKNQAASINANDDEALTAKDGFITCNLSSNTVFTGAAIRFTGESVKYKQYGSVELTIDGPATHQVRTATLSTDGNYVMDWTATETTGDFTVTAKSSDKKAQSQQAFTVQGIDWMDNWGDDNIEETKKAWDNLEEQVNNVKENISAKDKATLEKKLADVKAKIDDLTKLFKDLNVAGKATADLARKSKRLPPTFARNISDLGGTLADHAKKMKALNEAANHKPLDNTICEYLVMVNEACAAFSTVTNVATLNIAGILKNIALDKGVPKAVGDANEAVGSAGLPVPFDFPLKEAAKIYATSKFDAEALLS